MSDLVVLFERLAQLAAGPVLVVLVISAVVATLLRNWRIVLPALMIQSVVVGVLLARSIPPGVALIKPLTGIIAAVTLSIAAQRADNERAARGQTVATAESRIEHVNWRSLPAQVLVRAVATVLALTAAFGASLRFPLPGPIRELGLSAYVLVACGVLVAATASEALSSGVGVLMLIAGFELGYMPVERSISVSVLLGFMTLMVALAVAYLTLADGSALHLSAAEEMDPS